MWCGTTTEDQCIRDGIGVKCNGTALSLSVQFHGEDYDGPSCNYHPLDPYRMRDNQDNISRSYLDLCQDNR